MPKIEDLYAQLKSTLVGTRTQKVDAKLDQATKDIIKYKANSGRVGYINLVKSVISKTSNNMTISPQSGGIFAQASSGPTAFGQGARLNRYKSYEAIVANINYCHRALNVLTDNILSPDDITKISLEIKPKTFLEDELPNESRVKRVKTIIKQIKLEERLDIIVKNTLAFGDFFCEIASAKTALTSKTILAESRTYAKQMEESFSNGDIDRLTFKHKKKGNIEVDIDYRSFNEILERDTPKSASDIDTKKTKKLEMKVKNLNLVFHKPSLVVKLQSSLFPICFGYLVFPNITAFGIIGPALEDDMVNQICKSIIQSVEKKIPQMKEFKNDKELVQIIQAMIRGSDTNEAMQIRYVPPDKIVHFKIPSTKFHPYGESIFDSVQYAGKVLIALETALAVQRLSRSTEKRKIAVEIGLPRDAKNVIESMKEEFRKRKVSLDSFGTVDTIPSMITTFEDVYIPQKDGKPFVDISTFNEGNVDVRSKVDELKFMRDQMVASLGVPPSFIGIEENLSNKAALSEENILFARTVIGHQKYLTHQLSDLVQKIFDIIDPEEALTLLDNIDVGLPTPKSLQFEREARYMNEITGLIDSLERIGIPKEYSKRKYLPNFDWTEIKKYDIDEKVETAVDPSKKEDDMGDMGGMGGGMGASF
ncbi:MAG: portal protein [Candidatus Heimdallarchaeota archaeon]|nr:portal protein [Candidatus Heimdallarchaeota archaeon]